MRYQNWDALLFPEKSKIPMQEFKTTCHVVHDEEFLHTHNSILLLPTVTSFVPALSAGEIFRISIHSWITPEPSRYAQNYSRYCENMMFEARVFIDGRLVGAKIFSRLNDWPAVIENSIDLDKNGDQESLRFPKFHHELLTQNYWNAGDELGRIKIIIAEGFPRDSVTMPLERIKNIVAFSFQHAPLDVLESSSIAWPNPIMWRQVALPLQILPQTASPRQLSNDVGIEVHSHSPRRRSSSLNCTTLSTAGFGPMLPPASMFPTGGLFDRDPFVTQSSHNPWLGRQSSSTDTTMPDCSSSISYDSVNRQVSDPMAIDRHGRKHDNLQSADATETIYGAFLPSAPANTPQNGDTDQSSQMASVNMPGPQNRIQSSINIDNSQATTTPPSRNEGNHAGEVKSRKENRSDNAESNDNTYSESTRKVAQPFMITVGSGSKRQRVTTPAAFKAIDEEDEPRSSPKGRKISKTREIKEGDRRVLSGLERNIH